MNSFPNPPEGWAEVLRFTDSDTADVRVPAMFINSAGFTFINPFHSGAVNTIYPNESTWHKYEMTQFHVATQVRSKLKVESYPSFLIQNIQYFFQVKFDDVIIAKEVNPHAKEFSNVKIWTGLRQFIPHNANVEIRNLVYQSGEK